ncbi:MAG: hypothetical protein AAF378_01265 [Cyanobacteria bacterium P01_A01_bin.84]
MSYLYQQRISNKPFYTLGAASYLDAAENLLEYYQISQKINPILTENFDWLYKRLANTLETYLAAPVTYNSKFAQPGFHIFLSDKFFEQDIANLHLDTQYLLLDWDNIESIDYQHPISFTLPISLPKYGAGILVWDTKSDDITNLPIAINDRVKEEKNYITHINKPEIIKQMKKCIFGCKKFFYGHELGKITLQNNHMFHKIAPACNLQSDDKRITLQGHGLFCNGTWHLYW